jgi:membrane-associated phospholipid phosphatase
MRNVISWDDDDYAPPDQVIPEVDLPFSTRSPPRSWWNASYIGDYLLICLCFALVGILYFFVPPFQRYIPVSNSTDAILYPYPYEADLVPSWALSIIGFVGPIICFLIPQYWRRSAHDFHTTVLGLIEAQAVTLLLTEALKLAAGEYRPDYISIIDNGEPAKVVKDAQQSFPSGHSSLSFCAMSYLAMWLAANLGVFAKRGGGEMWKSLLSLLPLVVSFFVAISRVDNYRHNFIDITAGGLLGAAFGVYFWLLNYPPPSSRLARFPKLRRPPKFLFFGVDDDSDFEALPPEPEQWK